jgi:nitrogen regulatory protein P-II 2
MKRIDSILRPPMLNEAKERLGAVGVEALTVSEVRGYGRQRPHGGLSWHRYALNFVPKIMLTTNVLTIGYQPSSRESCSVRA